jgi:uncharacterized protein
MNLSEEDMKASAQAADALLAKLNGARCVVVATEDGFQVACATQAAVDGARLSAITSSMAAIGEVVSRETGIGQVRCVMVEADEGYLVMRGARRGGTGLVVCALVDRGALLGLVIHGVGETAKELSS